MKSIITRILEGDLHPNAGILDFSCAKIDLELCPGEDYEGTFQIYGPSGKPTEGFVYTDDLDMELYTREFAGRESEIAFCFHSGKTIPGDTRNGEFVIISNHGEFAIPYHITIIAKEIESSLGPVKNLFHFTNLAKTNWGEALNLFNSSSFLELLKGADKQYITIYRGLSGGNKNDQNMEEFLLAIKKKQKIEFFAGESNINLKVTNEPIEYLLPVTRNGWGFSNLYCQLEGDFLTCDKEVIREEDYLANTYKLPYYINFDKLYSGKNFGRIRLFNADTEINIPVTVSKTDTGVRKKTRRLHEHKSDIFKLMNLYIDFRAKQLSQAAWRKETEQLIDRMISASDKDLLPKLYRIQLLITENRINEASRLLNHADSLLAGREREMPELWCYYLYLTTLENRDVAITSRVAYEVERFYLKDRGNWRIGWLLCYLKEEYVANPAKKWAFLRELIKQGNNSPVILVEAWQLLKQKPEYLTRLDEFEIRLLLFAARRGLIPKSLIPQIVYLAGKSKSFSNFLYQILTACYEISNSDEVVQAICELLIKGEKTGPDYFSWYLGGVGRDINVTKLYEYFIFSLDQENEAEIPKQVLLYFAYNSEIDYRYQAYVYAFVHKNRDIYPEIYANYSGKIERFVANQLSRARTGKWLAYLYKNYITQAMINDDNVNGLADILFTVKIEILKENIREIIVLYDKVNLEITNRAGGKVNYIILYGMEYQIILVDSEGNRYAGPENYRIERWLNPDKIGRMIAPMVKERIGFDIWVCEQGDEIAVVTRSNLSAYERICLTDYLVSPYRETLCLNLIRFYHDFEENESLDKILKTLKLADIDCRYHEEILKILTVRQLYFEAYEWLSKISTQILDTKLILRILRYIIPDEGAAADRMILNLAFQSFKAAKYDEKILNYLINFYTGSIRKQRDIWLAGKSFGLDTFNLSERLLTQILYTGTFVGEQMEIFRDYVTGGGKGDIIKAFIIQNAYEYFANDKVIDAAIIRQMEKFVENNEVLDFICQLAFIKYFAENKEEINDNNYHNLIYFVQNLLDQNIYFAFFKEYIGILPMMDQFIDKTIIEYRTGPGRRIMIHYLIEGKQDYIIEPMIEMYDGIFVKQFLLFYGESISYYIAEEKEGQEAEDSGTAEDAPNKTQLTESGNISVQEVSDTFAGSRFNRINDIGIARQMQDTETLNALLAEYKQLEFLVDEIFVGVKYEE
ncbi:MAG: DUF5717 family protein [Lachnospiraceae bacterium]|nr:DUF5717 family protein [Lachnospiraceae bacterium]